MKQKDYLELSRFATAYGLVKNNVIQIDKVRQFIKDGPTAVKVLSIFIKEYDALDIKPGDAIETVDKRKYLVRYAEWNHVENPDTKEMDTKITRLCVTDVDGNSMYIKTDELRRLK